MPLYDFHCESCDSTFEGWQSITDNSRAIRCGCGQSAGRKIAKVSFFGNRTLSPPDRRTLPSSLRGVGGTREGVAHFQREEEKVSRFEEQNPTGAPQRMPVASHEGPRGVVYAKPSSATRE